MFDLVEDADSSAVVLVGVSEGREQGQWKQHAA
jgi:hypothetical protein